MMILTDLECLFLRGGTCAVKYPRSTLTSLRQSSVSTDSLDFRFFCAYEQIEILFPVQFILPAAQST